MPNLFPTEQVAVPATEAPAVSRVRFGRSWRFDFQKGDFVLTPTGKVAAADELEAFGEWCQKALLTPRYRHPIYSRNYGSEFEDLIGRGLTRDAVQSEIVRMVSEALLVDPRTGRVENFSFSWNGDAVSFTCDVVTVRGESVQVAGRVVIS